MQATHPTGSAPKATTAPDRQRAMILVGKAVIVLQVQKSPAARDQLETMADQARRLGVLSSADAALVAELLARPVITPTLN